MKMIVIKTIIGIISIAIMISITYKIGSIVKQLTGATLDTTEIMLAGVLALGIVYLVLIASWVIGNAVMQYLPGIA